MAKNKENASALTGDAGIQEFEALKSEWRWFLLLGVGLIVLGMIGIATPFFMSLATASIFGVLLLALCSIARLSGRAAFRGPRGLFGEEDSG